MDCFQEKPHPKRLNELKLDLEIQVDPVWDIMWDC